LNRQFQVMNILAAGVLILASSVSVAAGLKIGYVDTGRLLEEAPQARAATEQLKREFAPREEEMIVIQNELKALEDRLARDGAVMSESERKRMSVDILAKKREFRRKQEEFREDINLRRNDAIGTLQDQIKQAIEKVGRDGNYDLILYEGIAFANPALDITDIVLKGLGEISKTSAGEP